MKLGQTLFLKLAERANLKKDQNSYKIAELYYVDDKRVTDIAAELGITKGAVSKTIQRLNLCIETIELVTLEVTLSEFHAFQAKEWEKQDIAKAREIFKKRNL